MQTKNQTRKPKKKITPSPMLRPSILFKEKESKRRGRGAKRNKLTKLGVGSPKLYSLLLIQAYEALATPSHVKTGYSKQTLSRHVEACQTP